MKGSGISLATLFALMAAHQIYETARALHTKRVRRITFRKRYVELTEDSADYWLATVYHGFAALFLFGIIVVIVARLEA